MITINWHLERKLTVLNIYAPNETSENAHFWETLLEKYRQGKYKKPDIIAGDFNVTEEAIDRLPPREDPPHQEKPDLLNWSF